MEHPIPEHPTHWKHLLKGMLLMMLAWLLFSLMYFSSKTLSSSTSVSVMVFFRNAIGILILMPWMLTHGKESFKTSRVGLIIVRSLSGVLNASFVFLAVKSITLVDVSLLTNSAPLFIPFLVLIWLKKPVHLYVWPAVLLGFLGILCILRPDQKIFNVGALFGIASGLCTAISTLTVRLSGYTEKAHTVLFYFFFIGLIACTPFALLNWYVATPATYLYLLSLGLLSAFGQYLMFKSLRYGKASILAPISYTSVVFSGILDWIFFHQIPDTWDFIGLCAIILSGILVITTAPSRAK